MRPRAFAPYPSLICALRAYAPLPSSVSALRALFLSWIVLLQLKSTVSILCVYGPINHSPPISLLSVILPYKAVLHVFFISFILSHWLHRYLYNYFPITFSDFLFCFSFEMNLPNIQDRYCKNSTAWKVSKYGVFSGPCFPAFGPDKTPYLDTFHTM